MSQLQRQRVQYARGYPWLFFHVGRAWGIGLLVTCIVIGTGGSFYVWYSRFGNDIAPDSMVGYGYAISGTLCFVLAAVLYTLQRRSRKRTMGQLNAALNWHIFFAIMGIALLFMHSFGNFHAKTGTYALYGLIVLMINGFVGCALHRIMPRLITGEVSNMLTAEGEDRSEAIAGPGQPRAPFEAHGQMLSAPWDLAYHSLELPSQKMAREGMRYLCIADSKSLEAQIRRVQRAARREQFYRYIIHYWRVLHITLTLLAMSLIIWHLVYIAQLLLPTFFHHAE